MFSRTRRKSSGKKVWDTGKKVRDTFFKLVEGTDDIWVCRYGTKRKVKGSGYTNFVTHVQSQHPAERSALLADLSIATSSQSKSVASIILFKKSCSASWVVAVCSSLLATVSGYGRPKVHQTHSIGVADPKVFQNIS